MVNSGSTLCSQQVYGNGVGLLTAPKIPEVPANGMHEAR